VESYTLNKTYHATPVNEGESAASFCRQVAALLPDMFCNFHLVKNHKIAKTQQPLKLEKKINTDLEPVEFYNFLM
jgi:hypothetical protein